MKLAIVSPMLTKPKLISNITGNAYRSVIGFIGMPMAKPMAKTMMPCMKASVLSPTIFPRKIVKLETGATNVSFMKPNSLSQMTLMPMNMAVKSSV